MTEIYRAEQAATRPQALPHSALSEAYTKDALTSVQSITSLDLAQNSPNAALKAMLNDFTIHNNDAKYEQTVLNALDKSNPSIVKDIAARYSEDLSKNSVSAIKDNFLKDRLGSAIDQVPHSSDNGTPKSDNGQNKPSLTDVENYLQNRSQERHVAAERQQAQELKAHVGKMLSEKLDPKSPLGEVMQGMKFDPNKSFADNFTDFQKTLHATRSEAAQDLLQLCSQRVEGKGEKQFSMQRNVLELIAAGKA